MNEWHRTMMAKDHCDDMLRHALKEQMVKQARLQARQQAKPHPAFYSRALGVLGRRLATLGTRLQGELPRAAGAIASDPASPGFEIAAREDRRSALQGATFRAAEGPAASPSPTPFASRRLV